MAYPRVIEQTLIERGFVADVRNRALIAERASDAIRAWEAEVVTFSPDVVIVHYGYAEAIHLFAPRRFERHANGHEWRPTRGRRVYRRWIVRPTWKCIATVQVWVDTRMPERWTHRHKRIARDVAELISRMQQVLPGTLILVPELTGPSGRWMQWFPGMDGRINRINEALHAVVGASASRNLRWVETRDLIDVIRAMGDEPIPDGGHLSGAAHRLVGQRLGTEIAEWAATQRYLDIHPAEHADAE
jgi:hypothetical protein